MDSSKVINVNSVDLAEIDLIALRATNLGTIERLQSGLTAELSNDSAEICDRLSKSFRQFLLSKEQERMPFLQRVMTSHMENMEDERGFPPRHPVHWFKNKLEFSSTGVLQFDFQKEAESFIESALNYIEAEVKELLSEKQADKLAKVDRIIRELQQNIATEIQPIAKAKRTIASEYVNSFLQTDRMSLKAVDRFYFVSMGTRFNAKQELIYSEVCVRPTGLFNGSKNGDKPTQLKYAISCDRLLDVVNESIDRSVKQIHEQTQTYLSQELVDRVDSLFQGLS